MAGLNLVRMFTGIIREVGRFVGRFKVEADLVRSMKPGDSLAVNGTCLTATAVDGRTASFDVVGETLSRTNLGALRPGDAVNLEPPLAAGEPIGGHFVQGHVDGTGAVESFENGILRVAAPAELTRRMIPKGSIALDGVSLTLVDVGDDRFTVALIPFTLQNTTLGSARTVNIELDMLGKYVEKLMPRGSNVTMESLRKAGFS